MSDVFIAHVEEDAAVALEIALGLEEAGYTTWCYEVDSLPGPSYLIQTGQAVEQAEVLVLVISPHSVGSRQVTREVVRAHETGKEFVPVLRGITHIEFQNRQPEWREAVGAAASIRIPAEGVASILPRIFDGLKALDIHPGPKSEAARLARIRRMLEELHEGGTLGETGGLSSSIGKTAPEPVAVEVPSAKATEEGRGKRKWIRLVWIAVSLAVVIALSILAATLLGRSEQSSSLTFPDSNLEVAIREVINRPEGAIYGSDLEYITKLVAEERNIVELTGLEYCVNLEYLDLSKNSIGDISPLAGLTGLQILHIHQNTISDISPLAGLTALKELLLGRNNISDISPLAGLTNLRVLYLLVNNISDISPLVKNSGLSDGSIVNLMDNPLDASSVNICIPQLKQRGVNVLVGSAPGLLYEDDFSNPDSGWVRRSGDQAEMDYEDGEYRVLAKMSGALWVWCSEAGQFGDFALGVDARLVSGTEQAGYGLVFRRQKSDSDSFYSFMVSPGGYYLVQVRLNGLWTTLQAKTESAFIEQGNSKNHLEVICKGSQIALAVNGHSLATITDNSLTSGDVGIIVATPDPNADIRFDNISVSSNE